MDYTQIIGVKKFMEEHGSITTWDAIMAPWHCTRLSAVIFKLKEKGLEIESQWEKDDETGKRFKRYWIADVA